MFTESSPYHPEIVSATVIRGRQPERAETGRVLREGGREGAMGSAAPTDHQALSDRKESLSIFIWEVQCNKIK